MLSNGGIYHQMMGINKIEIKHTSQLIRLAHQARLNISLRPLSTGFAKDVSGSLRISRAGASFSFHHQHHHSSDHHHDGGGCARSHARGNEEEADDEEEEEEKEGEWLYHIIGDSSGSVRVFPRGDEYLS